MTEYISGEEHQAMKQAPRHHAKPRLPGNILGFVVALVVVAGLCFYGGVAYQKSKQPKAVATASSGFGSGGNSSNGGRFGEQRPTRAQVTAISASSITVQNSQTGSSMTFSITGSTQITDNGQTATASDIQTGDTVFVIANSSDQSQAARILVNPSFGGGAGNGGGGGSGSSGTSFNGPSDSGSAVTE